jgi:cytochrome c553
MNRNIVVVLLMITLVILIGIPESLARQEYLANLTSVYGDGSCGTCHIKSTGGGPRNDYGKLFENQPNYATDPVTALKAIGKPPESTVATPGATAALTATAQVTPAVTSVTARGTPAAAGFGFAVSLAGLLACALLARRHNK